MKPLPRARRELLRALLAMMLFAGGASHAPAAVIFSMTNATWRLFKGVSEASEPDTGAWRQRGFDDSGWMIAPSPILYSTAPTEPPFFNGGTFTGTTLGDMQYRYTSVFLRIPFTVADAASIAQLDFDVVSDDGFIAWLNGAEVARQNVPAGNVPFNGLALLSPPEPIPVASHVFTNAGALLTGTNILAVQALNRSIDSSDFGFMATLSSAADEDPPVVISISPPPDATVRALTQITTTFSEPIVNLTAADLLINGVTAASVVTNTAGQFVFHFSPPATGAVAVAWAAGQGITDLAGHRFGGGSWSYLLDTNVAPASVVISEFMAANNGSLRDEDGESSDWVEIYNPGPDAVALDGWFLTDTAGNPGKWRFPATNLAANAYLVVFASGKDRAVPGARLHTNFKLDADGSYLALVRPDGVVASAFSPMFLPQRPDVSFGFARELFSTPLVATGAAARVLVPTDGALALAWTGGVEPFNDSPAAGWIATATGIGFDEGGAGGGAISPLGYWNFDDAGNPALSRDASGHAHDGVITGASFTPDGGGRSGRPGDRAMNFGPANNGAFINVPDAAMGWFDSATARDAVTFALWIFGDESEPGINSAFYLAQNPDGTGIRVANAHLPWQDSVIYWDTGGYDGSQRVSILETDSTKWKGRWNHYAFVKNQGTKQIWQNGVKILDQPNGYPLQTARGFVIGAGANQSLWSYGGLIDEFAVWDSALSAAQIQALANGSTPLDLDSYAPLLGGNLGPAMRGRNASAFVRIAFVAGAMDFDTLLLRVRYDDGFVCWLNGLEIARRNAPAALAWNSSATGQRTKNEARTVEEINVSSYRAALRTGTNVLAFQALNSSSADAELLLLPELVAGRASGGLFFTTPTPGAPNGTGVAGFVADTRFSADRGFYFAPTNVIISSSTPGAYLVFTRDGTFPSPSNGTRVNAASPTLAPTATVAVATTTLLRAAAFKAGWEPADVDTQTYIFPAHVASQTRPGWVGSIWPDGSPADFEIDARVVNTALPGYRLTNALLAIPSLSLVTPSNDLFSAATGIYPNALSTGPAWERFASAELIFPDGRPGFHLKCGLRIHGGVSRYKSFTPKHSFSLLFREMFGASKLNFPLFPNGPVHEFDQLVLRGCSTDSWPVQFGQSLNGEPWPRWTDDEASYMRDQWMRDAQNALGHPSGHGLYVHLYLDGIYWGLYNMAERPDDSFAASYFGGQKEDYDVLSDFAELHAGDSLAWNQMMGLVNAGLSSDAAVERLQGHNPDGTRNPSFPVYLNLTNLIDYMILHIQSGADDWPDHNWWASRRRGPFSEGFRFFVWDQELANNSLQRTRTSWSPFPRYADVSTPNTPAAIFAALRQNGEFRVLFGDRVHGHLFNRGQLTVATNIARWQARHDELDRAVVAESARWGDYRRPAQPYRREVEWVSNQAWMVTTYFPSNLAIGVGRFRSAGLYPDLGAPAFSQFGGSVPENYAVAISHTNGASAAIYYTLDGSDPRLRGGAISPSARIYSVPVGLASPTLVRARVFKTSVWSALTEAQFFTPQDLSRLQLSEIMYNPPMFGTNDGDEVEFLELKNTGTNTLDLTGLSFTEGIQFVFTGETQLGPGQFFVLARNAALFAARYPGAPMHGIYTGRLNNQGETLTLSTPLGTSLFSVRYNNAAPWPAEADNSGLSLQRMHFASPPTNAFGWLAAAPTPGGPLPAELMDTDGDGMPDGWELAHDFDPFSDDANADADADGLSNRAEFLAGTDPLDPRDNLRLLLMGVTPGSPGQVLVLGFAARSNKTYSVIHRDTTDGARWTNLLNVGAQPTNRFVTVTHLIVPAAPGRYYRLASPRLP